MILYLLFLSTLRFYEINSDLEIQNEDQQFWELTKLKRQFLSHEIIVNKSLKSINNFILQKYFYFNMYGCKKYIKTQKRLGDAILIKAGRCSLIKKSYNAFLHGYRAIFIYGNYEEMVKSQKLFPNVAIIKLRQKQSRRLKIYMKKQNQSLKLQLKVIPINISMNLTLNVQSILSYKKLEEIKNLILEFKGILDFKPYYKFIDLRQYYSQFVLKEFCYDQGRFCLKYKSKASTKYFLKEQIKQMCLFDLQNNSKDFSEKRNQWWDYVQFYPLCLAKKLQGKKINCIKKYFKGQPILERIEQCYKNSFLQPLNKYVSENIYLRLKDKPFLRTKKVPQIYIGGTHIKNTDIQNIYQQICNLDFHRQNKCKQFLKSQKDNDNTLISSLVILLGLLAIKKIRFTQLIFQIKYIFNNLRMKISELNKQFLKLIYSRRFIRDRMLWTFICAFPGLWWAAGEFLKTNEILAKKATDDKIRVLQNFLYTDEVITEEEWNKYQDYIIYNQRR